MAQGGSSGELKFLVFTFGPTGSGKGSLLPCLVSILNKEFLSGRFRSKLTAKRPVLQPTLTL